MKYKVRPEKSMISGLSGEKSRVLKMLFTITTMVVSFATFGQSPEVRSAYRLIDIEQPTKGMEALEKLAGSSSQNQYYLGLAYLRTGTKENSWNKDKALAAFEKGISMNEKDGLNYAGRGEVKLIEKNATEAKANFDKALQVSKSKDASVLRAVGEAYLIDTKYVLDAITILTKAKGMNGGDPEIHMTLGDAYLLQNNGGESVSSYERAASADKKLAKPYYKIARVYKRSKNTDMVLENLNKAIATDPEFAPAYKELGETYYANKEAAKAVEAAEKYASITENQEQAKYALAFYYIMNKQFDKANAIFADVVNRPDAPVVALKYYGWALMLSDQDKSADAIAVFDRYFKAAKPEEVQALDYAFYGKALLKQSEVTKNKSFDSLANLAFASSIDLDSTQAEILQLQGDTYLKRKKFAEAVQTFKQLIAIRKQPLSQDLWSIGRSYYFNSQFMEADTAFTKLSEKQPNVTFGYLWAAKSRAQIDSTGEQGLAIPMYEKFIELALANPEKNKKDLIDAYDYMGQYALHKKDNVMEAKGYFEKILALDPNNTRAKEFMNVLKQAGQQQKGGK
jgi:tetratricopeptide (TPR) repeat protein